MQIDISKIKFDSRGLVPAVVVDVRTNDVVMLAYMNEESLLKTLETVRSSGTRARLAAICRRLWSCSTTATVTRCS